MKKIPLTQGQVAMVDDEDFAALSQYQWCAEKKEHTWYASRAVYAGDRKCKNVYMHRELSGAVRGSEVDHKNGNGLDNRRENIRVCSRGQNAMNLGLRKDSTSGFKGVSWHAGKWLMQISTKAGRLRVRHVSKLAAALDYNIQAMRHYGEFARMNDIFSGAAPPMPMQVAA